VARKAFLLRLDAKLFEELRRWADAELRSVNGQVEYILRRAVDEKRRGRTDGSSGGSGGSGGEKARGG
jgi:hypothetical protein